MKKRIGIKVLAFAVLAVVMTACNKYEEGANFSLRSAKARLVNTWTLVSYTIDGSSQTINGTLTYDIQKDGTAIVTASSGGFSFSDTGSWEFNSDKTSVILTDSNGGTDTYELVMLKNKDLKWRQTDNGYEEIWTFTGE